MFLWTPSCYNVEYSILFATLDCNAAICNSISRLPWVGVSQLPYKYWLKKIFIWWGLSIELWDAQTCLPSPLHISLSNLSIHVSNHWRIAGLSRILKISKLQCKVRNVLSHSVEINLIVVTQKWCSVLPLDCGHNWRTPSIRKISW